MSKRRSATVWSALLWLFATTAASAAEPLKVSQRWALLVGVDDYAYAQKLNYCGADQVELSKQLIAAGFPKDQVYLLHDKTDDPRQRPSQGNIERHVDLVLNLADADDLVVISFSGHGVHLGGKSYLCPSDCTLDDPKSLVSIDELYEKLKGCAARFKLVLVDACRNDPRPGGTRSMTATEGTRALARTLQELKLPEGVVLLNSCAPGEVSWEDEKFGHGVFMHYVLDGLRGAADTDGDGSVSLHELQAYAGQRTKAYVANQHRVAQRPFFKGDLTTDALEYALLPVPKVAKPNPASSQSTDDSNTKSKSAAELWTLGDNYEKAREYAKAMESYQAGAALGDGKNENAVGLLYLEGRGLPQDYSQARLWFEKAVAHGYAPAHANLGSMCRKGQGGPVDVTRALSLFRTGVDLGHAPSMQRLGDLYEEGLGVPRDYAQAMTWYKAAADKGHFPAEVSIAYLCMNGLGVQTDQATAFAWYLSAAQKGDCDAKFNLGVCYEYGKGTARNYAKALEYYQAAAKEQNANAENNLGTMIYNGQGVQSDLKTARGWYEAAASHGSPHGMFNLAQMYEDGEGGPRNLATAAEWYRKAADLGHPDAKKKVR